MAAILLVMVNMAAALMLLLRIVETNVKKIQRLAHFMKKRRKTTVSGRTRADSSLNKID